MIQDRSLTVLADGAPAADGRVSISDNMNGSVNVVVTGTTPSNLDEKIPVPAGVGRIVTTVPNPPPAPN